LHPIRPRKVLKNREVIAPGDGHKLDLLARLPARRGVFL
jgi:hypothetical protein